VRCNLVTVEHQTMVDFTAGHISNEDGAELIRTLQERLGSDRLAFHPGVSYRNLLVFRGSGAPAPFSPDTRTTPPHDLTDKSVLDGYPRGPGSDLLNRLMAESVAIFADHPANTRRRQAGKLPATNIWLWGQGSTPRLEPFAQRYAVQGAMITAVDLLRGLARLLGWRRIDVPGATGYTDTDYAAKGRYAIQALEETDLVCVHVEATDEASHEGDTAAKVRALEAIDRHIVAPVFEALKKHGEYRILVTPDHPTPLRIKTHGHGWVPWAMAGAAIQPDAARQYNETASAKSNLAFAEGWKLMDFFVRRGRRAESGGQ
jgi:2,3-bisphosphoglycerate-independent phosphoglycerate mutase